MTAYSSRLDTATECALDSLALAQSAQHAVMLCVGWNREEKQATADELAACRDAQAATEQQLAAQREAGEALAAQKAQLAADLAAKQQALEAALQRCEGAEASLSICLPAPKAVTSGLPQVLLHRGWVTQCQHW
jgi:hypothetical protein